MEHFALPTCTHKDFAYVPACGPQCAVQIGDLTHASRFIMPTDSSVQHLLALKKKDVF